MQDPRIKAMFANSTLVTNLDQIASEIEAPAESLDRLAFRLACAEESFEFLTSYEQSPSLADIDDKARRLEQRARDLLTEIGAGSNGLPLSLLIRLEAINETTQLAGLPVRTAIDGLRNNLPVLLGALKAEPRAIQRSRPGQRGGARHRGNPAARELVDDLISIHRDFAARPTGVSTSPTYQRHGPTIGFLELCLSLIGVKRSRESLRTQIKNKL